MGGGVHDPFPDGKTFRPRARKRGTGVPPVSESGSQKTARETPAPPSLFQVVLDASLEVRSAVVYASFIVALVFLPVLTMTGLQGRFFARSEERRVGKECRSRWS